MASEAGAGVDAGLAAGWTPAPGMLARRRLARAAARIDAIVLAQSPSHLSQHFSARSSVPAAGEQTAAAIRTARADLRRAQSLGPEHVAGARERALALIVQISVDVMAARPSPLQLLTTLGLHDGFAVRQDAEQQKSLSIAMAAILHAWGGSRCHIVCAGDYLAAQDASLLSPLFAACGCSVAALGADTPPDQVERFYGVDVLYATGRQLLSDFMRAHLLARTPGAAGGPESGSGSRNDARQLAGAAIIDDIEVVLMEDASSPVIISAAGTYSVLEEASRAALGLVDELQAGVDYLFEQQPVFIVRFTEAGASKLSRFAESLPPYWREARRRDDLLTMAVVARDGLQRDVHYVVQEGRVFLADENVHRLLAGRLWHFGTLQAVEAREGVEPSAPPRTIARTAFQSFFPRYARLAGVGSELNGLRRELWNLYRLPLLGMPVRGSAVSVSRRYAYADMAGKIAAVAAMATQLQAQQMPLMIAAPRLAEVAAVAQLLKEAGIVYRVADGRDPAVDAQCVAEAAQPGQITLLTAAALRCMRAGAVHAAQEGVVLHALLIEHWPLRHVDLTFFRHATQCVVFASLEDELLTRNLPLWALPLRWLAGREAARPLALRALVRAMQWRNARHGSFFRRALIEREEQLDQQLAFSRKSVPGR